MERIKLVHGGGGRAMHELISRLAKSIPLRKAKGGTGLDEQDDGAIIPISGKNLVFTTDSYTIKPLFFPGGDIGKLSVCGTINDMAVMGAKPIAISSAFVIGEGFPFSDLDRIVKSMGKISKILNVPIITADTKVVENSKNFGLIITTTGIGIAENPVMDSGLKSGDKIIVSGTIGDHGIAVMSEREGIKFGTKLKSDCAPLWTMINKILRYEIHAMKDPTRGGLASALNEIAKKSNVGIYIDEEKIPIKKEVMAASEMLGIDPLTVANEGKVVMGVADSDSDKVLKIIRKTKFGKDARIIGEVTIGNKGKVIMETLTGGKRIMDMPLGDPIPRVC